MARRARPLHDFRGANRGLAASGEPARAGSGQGSGVMSVNGSDSAAQGGRITQNAALHEVRRELVHGVGRPRRQLEAWALRTAPWRSYATAHLWRSVPPPGGRPVRSRP